MRKLTQTFIAVQLRPFLASSILHVSARSSYMGYNFIVNDINGGQWSADNVDWVGYVAIHLDN